MYWVTWLKPGRRAPAATMSASQRIGPMIPHQRPSLLKGIARSRESRYTKRALLVSGVATDEARFRTRSGLLTARRAGDQIVLDFPAIDAQACDAPQGLVEALGTPVGHTARNMFDYLVELESEAAVRSLQPAFERLAALPARGVIVTSRSADPMFDFVSRFFAPAFGIQEDPVTGSAHCCLGPFGSGRLGKTDLVGHQVSARGGVVRVEVRGDRVHLGGQAITIMRGELSA